MLSEASPLNVSRPAAVVVLLTDLYRYRPSTRPLAVSTSARVTALPSMASRFRLTSRSQRYPGPEYVESRRWIV